MALHRVAAIALTFMVLSQSMATAQTSPSPSPASTSTDQLLKPGELDALVAPIALYPDTLLSLVLMASTYPLEVIQADRWVKEHKKLKGDELKTAVDTDGDQAARAGSAGHHDRADRLGNALRAVLRSGGRVWRVALPGVSAVLLGLSWLHRCRTYCDRASVRRRLGSRKLGLGRKLLGWRS
jgi:hypothetical protein